MRLRVQTLPPLPDLKAWFVPRPKGPVLVVKTIQDIKLSLSYDLPLLQQKGFEPSNLKLHLEGFELLDDLPFDEVLRDGDLISIQYLGAAPQRLGKRKERDSFDGAFLPAGSAMSLVCLTICFSAESESDASSSATTSSSESASETSTSTESESESEIVSSASDSESPSDVSLRPGTIRGQKTVQPIVSVPPGYGKSSTRSRNRRRRLKKKHDREAKQPPPKNASEANTIPLGSAPIEKVANSQSNLGPEAYTPTSRIPQDTLNQAATASRTPNGTFDNTNGEIMMASLRNKNKKKNFRQTMSAPALRKIVFDDDETTQAHASLPSGSVFVGADSIPVSRGATDKSQGQCSSDSAYRVIPPSELAAQGLLPSNIFVTSVDFGKQPKNKKRKWTRDEIVATYEDNDEDKFADADVSLPYGDDDEGEVAKDNYPQFDWEGAEACWDQYKKITALDDIQARTIVGWKELAINPSTFTPEYMLSAGHVEELVDEKVIIQRIWRPGTEASAAFGIGGEEEGTEEQEYNIESILSLGWRVIADKP
ncbi:hypothetical protein AMATHDRAFT_5165 [Amanita thiersii Skay4041]|uniref:Uncharacterized protein n=1 Tax=Amanita thiersii Skay4041 TaxID=703135 RepID=A0A2A9NLD5_9AGAR|nr:hypothetical protein AMATHDRAFT_5165 [Amanita thiersii Skay4041]